MGSDESPSLAVYCTTDNGYVVPSIIALDSIRRFHPGCRYFVIANKNKISPNNIALLSLFDIELIHFYGEPIFKGTDLWPEECYWVLKGPEILWERGFKHSLSVDGDTLCVSSLDLENLLPRVQGYAGIENVGPRYENFKHPAFLHRRYGLSEEVLNGHNTNTGVVFWNNKRCVDSQLWQRSIECYQICTEGTTDFFNGDQALFALVSILEPALPWMKLPRGYNYRVGNVNDRKEHVEDVRIIHFTVLKPWKPATLRDRIAFPSPLLYRHEWFVFVEEHGRFNRDLSMKSPNPLRKTSRRVRYLFADWVINSSVSRIVQTTLVALVRKWKGGIKILVARVRKWKGGIKRTRMFRLLAKRESRP